MSSLTMLVLLPLFVGGLLAMGYFRGWSRFLSFVVAIMSLFSLRRLWLGFADNVSTFQIREFRPLFGSVNYSWNLGVDGWNILALTAFALVGFVAVIMTDDDRRLTSGWILMVVGSVIALLTSINMALTLMFLGVLAVVVALCLQESDTTPDKKALKVWLGMMTIVVVSCAVLAGQFVQATQGSLNYASILRYDFPAATRNLHAVLILIVFAGLAGLFPFSGWKRQVLQSLPRYTGLVVIVGCNVVALMFVVRYLLPLHQDFYASFASTFVFLALLWAWFEALSAWIADELPLQLTHLIGMAVALSMAALFLKTPRGAVGAVTYAFPYMIAIAAAWGVAAWLERATKSPADWWSIKTHIPNSGALRFYALLALAGVAAIPLTAAFSGQLLINVEVVDRAVKSFRASKTLGDAQIALAFIGCAFFALIIVSQHLWFIGQRRTATPDYALSPRVREVLGLVLLLSISILWGVRSQAIADKVEPAIKFTFEKRLSTNQPVRAPIFEKVDP